MKKINIAVDGTAGSGKSSTFERVADILGYNFIDTGLMYRAFTYLCFKNKVDFSNEKEIINVLKKFNPSYKMKKLFLDDIDVTEHLMTKNVLDNINKITVIQDVRKKMVELQKDMAKTKGNIMIGRDITSVVLPNAELKIFFDCSIEERAKRRYQQMLDKNIKDVSFDEIYKKIEARDYNDKNRKDGPLIITNDSWYIDSTKRNINELVEEIVSKIKEN